MGDFRPCSYADSVGREVPARRASSSWVRPELARTRSSSSSGARHPSSVSGVRDDCDSSPGLAQARRAWFRIDGYLDTQQFLDEILSGRRRPYSGPELGLRQAAWALDTDVADYCAFTKKMAERQASRPVPQQFQARAGRSIPSGERTGDHPTARTPTDDRARAAIREQAATDLTQRIHQIEARISELKEHKAKLAVTGHLTDGADLELGKLAARLAILRRQNALLTEGTAAAPGPPPSMPPRADPSPISAPTERSPPAQRPWWLRLLRRKNASG